ncbi:M3 family metallopeptidase [Cellulomonas sp. P24]|uniref:M3 family metallopeptidase n=1 Tax=Cellulomonas sp. P24 TaxID=2885206 RepID=UPI00216AFCB3|nr:M3 family metallopeptidase [Cellulomonas sp. P24]MCR6491023.1 M3 family metallopeptidase [Cellulomonas sp. P24]
MSDDTTLDPRNPFATPSTLPYGLPDFAAVREEHYRPAFVAGMAQERAEVEAILADPAPPTVENTLDALERAGLLLARAATDFFTRHSADTTPGLDAIEDEVAPLLAAHEDAIQLDPRLLDRLDALQEAADLGTVELAPDAAWLLRTRRRDAVRAGARLAPAAQERLRALNQQISVLEATFGRTVLAASNAGAVLVRDRAELAGLPADMIESASRAAAERGHGGAYLLDLHLPTQQPVLALLTDRAVRERVHRASVSRGSTAPDAARAETETETETDHDTRATLLALVRARAERARLLGFPHHAAYVADDGTAGSVEAVQDVLERVTGPAVARARLDETDRADALMADVPGATLEAWDWTYYAEQARSTALDVDDSRLRPYLELDRVLHEGVFRAAGDLYGLTFHRRSDLVGYHPDVRVYEARSADGTGVGLYLADLYARDSKRGGAWMNSLVDQSHLLGTRPVVITTLNIGRPRDGEVTLLTVDEVVTLFHEFGHALHGLLSDVRYPSQSGTNVPRDTVEYPSQVNEMWVWDPTLLREYAVHHVTGEPIPDPLATALVASQVHDSGFLTTEHLAAVHLDQAWHRLGPDEVPSEPDAVTAFEDEALARAGVALATIPPRYRSTYFTHVFAGGYAAAYYSYLWSEILDADTAEWFRRNGGRTRENGETFRRTVLSRGGSVDPMQAFRELHGRDPDIGPLLARKGLTGS